MVEETATGMTAASRGSSLWSGRRPRILRAAGTRGPLRSARWRGSRSRPRRTQRSELGRRGGTPGSRRKVGNEIMRSKRNKVTSLCCITLLYAEN